MGIKVGDRVTVPFNSAGNERREAGVVSKRSEVGEYWYVKLDRYASETATRNYESGPYLERELEKEKV